MLTPSVKLQDVGRVLWPLAGRHKTRAVTLAYVRDHWDALRGKLIGHLGRGLVGMAGFACTPQALTESRAFYTQKAATLEGAGVTGTAWASWSGSSCRRSSEQSHG